MFCWCESGIRFVVAPTCVREEPNKVHSSILILEPVTGKNLEGLTSKYIDIALVNKTMRGFYM